MDSGIQILLRDTWPPIGKLYGIKCKKTIEFHPYAKVSHTQTHTYDISDAMMSILGNVTVVHTSVQKCIWEPPVATLILLHSKFPYGKSMTANREKK